MPPKEDIEVSWEDQRMICSFGRMNLRFNELIAEIKTKESEVEDLKDASNEIYATDEIRGVMGICFIKMDCDVADTMISGKKEAAEEEIARLVALKEAVETKMSKMKAILYAKFGTSIYLENE